MNHTQLAPHRQLPQRNQASYKTDADMLWRVHGICKSLTPEPRTFAAAIKRTKKSERTLKRANENSQSFARHRILIAFAECIYKGIAITRAEISRLAKCSVNTAARHSDIWKEGFTFSLIRIKTWSKKRFENARNWLQCWTGKKSNIDKRDQAVNKGTGTGMGEPASSDVVIHRAKNAVISFFASLFSRTKTKKEKLRMSYWDKSSKWTPKQPEDKPPGSPFSKTASENPKKEKEITPPRETPIDSGIKSREALTPYNRVERFSNPPPVNFQDMVDAARKAWRAEPAKITQQRPRDFDVNG